MDPTFSGNDSTDPAFNSYGLFRVMTKTRPEIIIEGSLDRFNWHTYQFRWKPTAPNQSLGLLAPHATD